MQKVSLRKVKTPIGYLQENNEEILHFSLQGLLPTDHSLALNTTLVPSPTSSVRMIVPIC